MASNRVGPELAGGRLLPRFKPDPPEA